MQEKVFSELAQNLNSLPPQMRAKGNAFIQGLIKKSLIKSQSFIRNQTTNKEKKEFFCNQLRPIITFILNQ
jgi:hypothetical protein